MSPAAWIGGGLLLLVVFVLFEGWRQRRRLRERGETVSDRPGMAGIAALEMQRLLEPERKVELLQQEAREEEPAGPAEDERGGSN